MTLSEGRTIVRVLLATLSTAKLDDATLDAWILDAYVMHRRRFTRWGMAMNGADTGFGMTAGNVTSTTTTGQQSIAEHLSIYRQTTNTEENGVELEWMPLEEIVRLQVDQGAVGDRAAPRYCFAHRFDAGQAIASTSPIRWRLFCWPIPDGAYFFSAKVVTMAQLLTAGGQSFELPEDECYVMLREAAMLGACILGKPEEAKAGILRNSEAITEAAKSRAVKAAVRRGLPVEVAR